MSTLDRAIEIAVEAHAGQVDKAGQPYILHPLRVMLAQTTDEARIVGVLHDVIEDSDWTINDLRHQRFGQPILEAVWALTRRKDEEYSAYVERAGANPLSRSVKLADLRDNMRPDRPCPESLRKRYAAAIEQLA